MNFSSYFKKLVSYGLIFSSAFSLLKGGINLSAKVQAKDATKLVVKELPKESLDALENITKTVDKKEIEKNFKRLVKTPRVRGTKDN